MLIRLDWSGRLSEVTNGSGFVVEYMHDIMDSVTNISWRTTSGARIGSFEYEYDAAGRIVSTISLSARSTRSTRLNSQLYLYNELNDRVATVSDRNFNSIIDWAGPDLVSSNLTYYVKLDGDWWRETRQWSIHDERAGTHLAGCAFYGAFAVSSFGTPSEDALRMYSPAF